MRLFLTLFFAFILSVSLFAGYITPDREITAYKAPLAPTIDGVEDSLWQHAVAYAVTRPDSATEYWELESGDDYAGWFKVMWDADNVYFFCWVMDDVLIEDETGDNDKIEFFFDADASGGITQEDYELDFAADYGAAASWWFEQHAGQTQVYDEDCSQWVFEIDKPENITGTQGPGLAWPGMAGSRFPTEGIVYELLLSPDDAGYTLEVAFPWQSLQALTPMKEGDRFGLNFQFNDFDVEGERAFYDWIEDFPNVNWCDPSVFGSVVLSETTPADGFSMHAGMAGTKPNIDGQMDDVWSYAMPRAVTIPDGSTEFSGLEGQFDYVGTFRSMWDADNIYFFFDVIDDVLHFDETGDNDKVELIFDADASGGMTADEYNEDFGADYGPPASWWLEQHPGHTQTYDENCSQWVFEIDKAENITGTQGPGLAWPGMAGSRFPTEGIEYQVVFYDDEYGYTMEILIPWASLNAVVPMGAGDEVGLNIQINDFDVPEERGFYDWRNLWFNSSWCDPTNFGLLELSAMEITGIPTAIDLFSNSIPESFELRQNYPNPFNPATTIEYSLAKQSHVTLDVYNLLGEHVASLVNQMKAPGLHTVTFDAAHLTSGVYIYKLMVEDKAFTKKMVLTK